MIELWLVDLVQSAPALRALEHKTPRLPEADRKRALRLKDSREGERQVAAYAALRLALERWAGPGVRQQPFVRNAWGKPHLAEASIEFSLSHAGGFALIGVSGAGEIGVDIEASRVVRTAPHRREAILGAAAGLGDSAIPWPATDAAFLQAWSRLEAYAKARGQGLAKALAELKVRNVVERGSLARVTQAARNHVREAKLQVVDLQAPQGYHAAVAAPRSAPIPPLKLFPSKPTALSQFIASAGP